MSTGRRCLAPLSLASGFLLNLSWSGWIAKHGVDGYYSCFLVKQFHVTSPVEVPRVFRLPSIIPPIFLLGSSFRILQFSQYLRKGQAFPAADFYLPWILTPGLSPISGTGQRLLCACTLDLLGNFWNVGESRMSFWNQGWYRSPGPGGCFVVPDNLSVGNLRNQVHWLWDWCLDWTSFFLVCTCNVNPHPMVDCQLYWKKTWGTASKAEYDAVNPRWFVLWAVPWSSTSSVPGKP